MGLMKMIASRLSDEVVDKVIEQLRANKKSIYQIHKDLNVSRAMVRKLGIKNFIIKPMNDSREHAFIAAQNVKDETYAKMLERYNARDTAKEIAEKFGYTTKEVHKIFWMHDLKFTSGRPVIPRSVKDRILELTKQNISQEEIGKMLNISPRTISEHQIKSRVRSESAIKYQQIGKKTVTIAQKKKIIDMYKHGIHMNIIVRATGLKAGTIYYQLRKEGLTKKFKQKTRHRFLNTTQQLVLTRMTDQGLSQRVIGKRIGISPRTVKRYQYELGHAPKAKYMTIEERAKKLKIRRTSLKSEIRNQIVQLTKDKMTQRAIGKKLGINPKTVGKYQCYYRVSGYRELNRVVKT